MRMMIVGVGQTLNFETKEMEDVLHVEAEDGSIIVVPTTNEAAQALVKLAMNGAGEEPVPQRGTTGYSGARELAAKVEERFEQRVAADEAGEEYPDGAQVFGGGEEVTEADQQRFQQMMRETAPDTGDPTHGNPDGPHMVMDGQELFQQIQETVVSRQKGVTAKMDDRSGVATRTLSGNLVDAKGNPVTAHAPDDSMDDEEDPGEQI